MNPEHNTQQSPDKITDYLRLVTNHISKIETGTTKMIDMINSLMTKSRSDKSESIEPVDINTILLREIEFLEADYIFKHKTKKTISLLPGALVVDAVPGEIAQIFQNLVRNALDAMYEQDHQELTFSSGKDKENVWFSVSDNGPGIPEEMQKKVFDPFFTTKPKAGENENGKPTGTGLGLHMCMQMARTYHGTITLQSKPAEGTCIKAILPASKLNNSQPENSAVHDEAV
jgi:signal transduction histidine kinase